MRYCCAVCGLWSTLSFPQGAHRVTWPSRPCWSRSEVEARVDPERHLVVIRQAAEECLARIVVANLGADLQVLAEVVVGERRDRLRRRWPRRGSSRRGGPRRRWLR